jgi:hypothetical protein
MGLHIRNDTTNTATIPTVCLLLDGQRCIGSCGCQGQEVVEFVLCNLVDGIQCLKWDGIQIYSNATKL